MPRRCAIWLLSAFGACSPVPASSCAAASTAPRRSSSGVGRGSVRNDCDTSCVNEQDSGAERHINIHLSPEIMGGVYANFANVSHSDYEFTVTFARVDHEVESEEVPGVVVSRVNLSPRFMRELIDAMEDNYSKWRTREGIKNLPEYGGTEAPSEDE